MSAQNWLFPTTAQHSIHKWQLFAKHFFDKSKLILRSQVRNSTTHLTLIYHHQSKRRSECANSVISNRGTACMSHMSTVDSHSDKRLKGHDTTNSRNLTNISFFEMEKIKFYFGSLTKGSAYENARFLEYVLKNTYYVLKNTSNSQNNLRRAKSLGELQKLIHFSFNY